MQYLHSFYEQKEAKIDKNAETCYNPESMKNCALEL